MMLQAAHPVALDHAEQVARDNRNDLAVLADLADAGRLRREGAVRPVAINMRDFASLAAAAAVTGRAGGTANVQPTAHSAGNDEDSGMNPTLRCSIM